MTLITWNDHLKRGIAFQDADHEESVALMNALQTCPDAEFPARFAAHLEHLRAHLERENALMERTGFFAKEMHMAEHARVLAEHDEMLERLNAGDLAQVRRYAQEEVPAWFLGHLESMDTMTALHARQRGEN